MRKLMALLVVLSLLMAMPRSVFAAVSSLPGQLTVLEEMLYGRAQNGSLVERLSRLERDYYGDVQTGPLLARAQMLHDALVYGGKGESFLLRLNVIEWMMFQELTTNQPLNRRLEHVEMGVLGERQSGPIHERLNRLMDFVWPGGRLNVQTVKIPKETLVLIRLLNEVDSSKTRVGQTVPYRVARDVMIEGRLVIPKGTEGTARVTKVESAGQLGRSGHIELDFGHVRALDGTELRLRVAERSAKENTDMAAAASVAGAVLLGPIGLVGGYFVRGDEQVIPAGTEFYVEVDEEATVSGLALTPAEQPAEQP